MAQRIGSSCISSQWARWSTSKCLASACCSSCCALQKPSSFPSSTCIDPGIKVLRQLKEMRGKETCSALLLLFCRHTKKSSPPRLQLQHSDAARIIHSQVNSREHRAELAFRHGLAGINNNSTHSHRFRAYNTMTDDGKYLVLLSLAYLKWKRTHLRALL